MGWSTSAVHNYIGEVVGYNGLVTAENTTGGTMLLGNGWKVINFVWMNDYTQQSGESVNNFLGGWYETGREHIAPRFATTYVVPSGGRG
jgi:hypothetical protein